MTIYCEYIDESAALGADTVNEEYTSADESALIGDAVVSSTIFFVEETAVIGSLARAVPDVDVIESAQVGDALISVFRLVNDAAEAALLRSTVISPAVNTVVETASISGAAETPAFTGDVLTEGGVLSSVMNSRLVSYLSETAIVKGGVDGLLTGDIEESAILSSAMIHTAKSGTLIDDTAILSSALSELNLQVNIINETATISGEATNRLTAVEFITDDGEIVGVAFVDSLTGAAWCANAATMAMSRFTEYPFQSFAVIDGVPFGSAGERIYRLDAAPPASSLKSGVTDDGSTEKKRLANMIVGHTGEEPLTVTVSTATPAGLLEGHTYDEQSRAADSPTNGRFIVGRGLSSRWWQFELNSDAGERFELIDLRADFMKTTRRI